MKLIGAALVLTFLVTLGPLQRIFETVSLTTRQWGICLLAPIVFLGLIELATLLDRRRSRRPAERRSRRHLIGA